MTVHAGEFATPVGPLLVLTEDGVVIGAGFCGLDRLLGRAGITSTPVADADLGAAGEAMTAYLAGEVDALAAIPVRQPGGEFATAAWEAMRRIPAGETVSYAELAREAGRPAAVRAAGSACARNGIAPIVACHRVVRSDGSLGGYAFGLPVKTWLLDHERAHTCAAPAQPALDLTLGSSAGAEHVLA